MEKVGIFTLKVVINCTSTITSAEIIIAVNSYCDIVALWSWWIGNWVLRGDCLNMNSVWDWILLLKLFWCSCWAVFSHAGYSRSRCTVYCERSNVPKDKWWGKVFCGNFFNLVVKMSLFKPAKTNGLIQWSMGVKQIFGFGRCVCLCLHFCCACVHLYFFFMCIYVYMIMCIFMWIYSHFYASVHVVSFVCLRLIWWWEIQSNPAVESTLRRSISKAGDVYAAAVWGHSLLHRQRGGGTCWHSGPILEAPICAGVALWVERARKWQS